MSGCLRSGFLAGAGPRRGIRRRVRARRGVVSGRAAETGLDFVHFNGMTGNFHQTEMAWARPLALLDYDNDGDLDVYHVTQGRIGWEDGRPADPAAGGSAAHGDRLYRNDLEIVGRTASPGCGSRTCRPGAGMDAWGATAWGSRPADYGQRRLGRPLFDRVRSVIRCSGTTGRRDVLGRVGTRAAPRRSPTAGGCPAAFLRLRPRRVAGPLRRQLPRASTLAIPTSPCFNRARRHADYCPPEVYRGRSPIVLYRNRGDGTFVDATAEAGDGPTSSVRPSGSSTADFDNDGWTRHLRRQRSAARISCGSTGRDGTFRQPGALVPPGRRSASGRRGQGGHGRRCRRLRQRRRRGPLHHGAVRSGQHSVCERRGRPVPGSERRARHPRPEPAVHRLRDGLDRPSTTTAGSTSSR